MKHYLLKAIMLSARFLNLAILLSVSCSSISTKPPNTPEVSETLPSPEVYVTSAPDAELAAAEFLEFWRAEDYSSMYSMLTRGGKDDISEEDFIKRYADVANEVALRELEYSISPGSSNNQRADIPFRVTFQSAVIAAIEREMVLPLELEDGSWHINWDESLIMPELAGGNYLLMDRDTPERGAIYDRNGNPIAAQAEAVAIGVWPDFVDLRDEETINGLVSLLSGLTGYRSDRVITMIENAPQGSYLPFGEITVDQDPRRIDLLSTWGAAVTSRYSSRFYFGNGIAPHAVGYVSSIQEDEIVEYRRLGFRQDEYVGRKGIELWGNEILSGMHGGILYVFNPEGKPFLELGSNPGIPGEEIFSTIDGEFQLGVQKAMSVFSGAIVVLERDTGRVLAMASSPGFDPNAFQTSNYNWNALLNGILSDPNTPQFNRASQGQYPLGSVFKLITISAALESGRYSAETEYNCGYTFEELPGFTRYDWTYEHFQEDGTTQPSGLLTLPEGLIRSCNPFFWHIGLDLYTQGLSTAISDMARGFGLGSLTGIEVVEEEPGNIPTPADNVDAINLAIGQGDMVVTPLQVARFAAALGNGGTLYRPQLIERILNIRGEVSFVFGAEPQGTLPLSPDNLSIIQQAMVGVVRSQNPVGTAYSPFRGLDIAVAGKTGTATSAIGDPHAWFAGYTIEGREDKPDIAIAVIAENSGEGSEIAAPIFRRVVELYFYGQPFKVYPWESTFEVTREPTPIGTLTPTPSGPVLRP